MCLIVFAWRPGHAQPLIVAANRDEFYARPSLPLAQWLDAPDVYAGRDQEAGGTWLGVNTDGRFAALTNIRDPHQPPARKSCGELVARFLSGSLPIDDYLADVNGRSIEYAGFNLLVGTRDELWHYKARDTAPSLLAPGVYGLSNAGLDTPWPKLLKAKSALIEVKMIVARDVPTARWVSTCGSKPCKVKLNTSTGTIMIPPPTPNSPASTPAQAPSSKYSRNSMGAPEPSPAC